MKTFAKDLYELDSKNAEKYTTFSRRATVVTPLVQRDFLVRSAGATRYKKKKNYTGKETTALTKMVERRRHENVRKKWRRATKLMNMVRTLI